MEFGPIIQLSLHFLIHSLAPTLRPSLGDILCEIQTDKAVVGFELEEEGFLAKILVPLDAKAIAVGQPIAIIVDSKDDIAKASVNTPAAAPAAAPAPAPTPTPAAAPAPAAMPEVGMVLNMPSLSPTMNEGTIVEWLKKEGDEINPGTLSFKLDI